MKALDKCRQELLDLNARPSLEMESTSLQIRRAITSFTAKNPEIKSNSLLINPESIISHVQNSPSSSSNQNSQIFSNKVADENVRLKDNKDRLEKVESINRDLVELHEIATSMSALVNEQGEVVDNIEANITDAEEKVTEGTKSLIKASGYAGAMGPITCAAIGGAVLGPVGAVVGLKIGLASAFGGSIISYCGAKFVQNKNLDESKADMNKIDQTS